MNEVIDLGSKIGLSTTPPIVITQSSEINPKKRHYIYLAGAISDDPRTYEWRDEFSNAFSDEPRVVMVNPSANDAEKSVKANAKSGLDFVKKMNKMSQKILRAKDYKLISMCNIMIVHLGFTTPDKPLVGTIQELAWARDIFYAPVIAITAGIDNIYTSHPWIDECCSAKVETVAEATEIIKTFFLDY